MSPVPHIVFGLTDDVRRNSRALRQLRAFGEADFTVHVLTFGNGDILHDLSRTVHVQNIPRPAGQGPRFFAAVHRLFARAAAAIPAQVYHASDLYTLPAMARAARIHGARLAYDARELYPHVGAIAAKPWSSAFWYAVERHYIWRADAVFTVSEAIARWLAEHYRIPTPVLLPNVPPRRPVPRTDSLHRITGAAPDAVIVLYQGYLKPGRGCEQLLAAARDVPEVTVVFLGEGPLQSGLTALIEAYEMTHRVHILPMAPPDELLAVTASADIGACLIEDLSLSLRYALPNKLFEYLMAGIPVLASDLPEIRRVVEVFDVGLIVDPSDHGALVGALRRMAHDAEARRRWSAHTLRVFETYSWEAASEQFLRIYRSLLV